MYIEGSVGKRLFSGPVCVTLANECSPGGWCQSLLWKCLSGAWRQRCPCKGQLHQNIFSHIDDYLRRPTTCWTPSVSKMEPEWDDHVFIGSALIGKPGKIPSIQQTELCCISIHLLENGAGKACYRSSYWSNSFKLTLEGVWLLAAHFLYIGWYNWQKLFR